MSTYIVIKTFKNGDINTFDNLSVPELQGLIKADNGIREQAVRDSFINYVSDIDNPVSRYMQFKDGSWSMLDKDRIGGWNVYGETFKPTYVEYNHRTNEILGVHNIVPNDLSTLIKLYIKK